MDTTLALFFGNRGFFPGELIAAARNELDGQLQKLGFKTLVMPEGSTRYGAVETLAEELSIQLNPRTALIYLYMLFGFKITKQ